MNIIQHLTDTFRRRGIADLITFEERKPGEYTAIKSYISGNPDGVFQMHIDQLATFTPEDDTGRVWRVVLGGETETVEIKPPK